MLKVYTDAATKGNPGPSGAGVMIIGEQIYEQLSFPLPEVTNHQAEFLAIIKSLEFLSKPENNFLSETIFIHSDSKIAIQTIQKNHAKDKHFQYYLHQINHLSKNFPFVFFKWIPENQNKGADNLARQGLEKSKKEYSLCNNSHDAVNQNIQNK